MLNKAMERKLKARECLDVRKEGEPVSTPAGQPAWWFTLRRFVDDIDYCDAETERWIWSIGRRYSDGVIIASVGSELYQNEKFDCLFLR